MNNLTQAELDQLMNTSSMGGSGGGSSSTDGLESAPALSPEEIRRLTDFYNGVAENQGSVLSTYISVGAGIRNLSVSSMTKDGFLQNLPMEVVNIAYDYTGGVSGDHFFVLSLEDGKNLASQVAGMPDMDLDDAAISAIAEVLNGLAANAVETYSDKSGVEVSMTPSSGEIIPKASVVFNGDQCLVLQYVIDIQNDGNATIYEVFDLAIARKLLGSMAAPQSVGMDQPFSPQGVPGGMMQQPGQQYQQMPPQQQGMYQQPMMPQGYGGQMGMPMQGMPQQNVQSVQFSDFRSPSMSTENKKYGILMDVFMELTVELGRTKKMVKEILSMGEGTIIELDKLAGEPVDILVNHNLLARGEVVVIGDNFGVRVSEIISKDEKSDE